MRNKELKKILYNTDDASIRGMLVRLGYELLIEELIKEHPNPKAAFHDTIKNYPYFKEYITDLADLLKLDLGIMKK